MSLFPSNLGLHKPFSGPLHKADAANMPSEGTVPQARPPSPGLTGEPHPHPTPTLDTHGKHGTPEPSRAGARLGVAGLALSYKCPRGPGLTHDGQAETACFPVIPVTPGRSTSLMTPGGKAGWSHGRAGPGLEGPVKSAKGEAMLPIPPQSPAGLGRQRTQQRREASRGGGPRLACLKVEVRLPCAEWFTSHHRASNTGGLLGRQPPKRRALQSRTPPMPTGRDALEPTGVAGDNSTHLSVSPHPSYVSYEQPEASQCTGSSSGFCPVFLEGKPTPRKGKDPPWARYQDSWPLGPGVPAGKRVPRHRRPVPRQAHHVAQLTLWLSWGPGRPTGGGVGLQHTSCLAEIGPNPMTAFPAMLLQV